MAFHWRADGGQTFAWWFVVLQGIRTSIAKKPFIFVIFRGPGSLSPHLDPRINLFFIISVNNNATISEACLIRNWSVCIQYQEGVLIMTYLLLGKQLLLSENCQSHGWF